MFNIRALMTILLRIQINKYIYANQYSVDND